MQFEPRSQFEVALERRLPGRQLDAVVAAEARRRRIVAVVALRCRSLETESRDAPRRAEPVHGASEMTVHVRNAARWRLRDLRIAEHVGERTVETVGRSMGRVQDQAAVLTRPANPHRARVRVAASVARDAQRTRAVATIGDHVHESLERSVAVDRRHGAPHDLDPVDGFHRDVELRDVGRGHPLLRGRVQRHTVQEEEHAAAGDSADPHEQALGVVQHEEPGDVLEDRPQIAVTLRRDLVARDDAHARGDVAHAFGHARRGGDAHVHQLFEREARDRGRGKFFRHHG